MGKEVVVATPKTGSQTLTGSDISIARNKEWRKIGSAGWKEAGGKFTGGGGGAPAPQLKAETPEQAAVRRSAEIAKAAETARKEGSASFQVDNKVYWTGARGRFGLAGDAPRMEAEPTATQELIWVQDATTQMSRTMTFDEYQNAQKVGTTPQGVPIVASRGFYQQPYYEAELKRQLERSHFELSKSMPKPTSSKQELPLDRARQAARETYAKMREAGAVDIAAKAWGTAAGIYAIGETFGGWVDEFVGRKSWEIPNDFLSPEQIRAKQTSLSLRNKITALENTHLKQRQDLLRATNEAEMARRQGDGVKLNQALSKYNAIQTRLETTSTNLSQTTTQYLEQELKKPLTIQQEEAIKRQISEMKGETPSPEREYSFTEKTISQRQDWGLGIDRPALGVPAVIAGAGLTAYDYFKNPFRLNPKFALGEFGVKTVVDKGAPLVSLAQRATGYPVQTAADFLAIKTGYGVLQGITTTTRPKIPKGFEKEFRAYKYTAKGFEKTKFAVKDIDFSRIQNIPKEAREGIKAGLIKSKAIVGGTGALETIGVKLKRLPKDIDAYVNNPAKALKITARQLNTRRVDFQIKDNAIYFKGAEGYSAKGIEFNTISGHLARNFATTKSPITPSGFHIFKTPSGIRVVDPRVLLKRKYLGGFEDNLDRYSKDIPAYVKGGAVALKITRQAGETKLPVFRELTRHDTVRGQEFLKPYLGKGEQVRAEPIPNFFKGKEPAIFDPSRLFAPAKSAPH